MKEFAKLLFDLIRAPFTKGLTVAQVVKEMEVQVDRLLSVAAEHSAKAKAHRAKAAEELGKADEHVAEATRAARVAEKFVNLLK